MCVFFVRGGVQRVSPSALRCDARVWKRRRRHWQRAFRAARTQYEVNKWNLCACLSAGGSAGPSVCASAPLFVVSGCLGSYTHAWEVGMSRTTQRDS